jgi:transglycosylase-like protein with SLT domain
MIFGHSLIIVVLVSGTSAAAAVAGEPTTLRGSAVIGGQKDWGRHATKDARGMPVAPLDRVATAVDGAESSHGQDIRMWRADPAAPQGPMQVTEAAATDVGGGDRFDLAQNRAIGRAYLAQLYRRYKNWPDAIAAYNWGLSHIDAWIKAGRPTEKLSAGVAAYTIRVLHDSGLCYATQAKQPRSPAVFRGGAVPVARAIFVHFDAADAEPTSNREYLCGVMPSGFPRPGLPLKQGAGRPQSAFEQTAVLARSSWRSALRSLGCSASSGDSLRCK